MGPVHKVDVFAEWPESLRTEYRRLREEKGFELDLFYKEIEGESFILGRVTNTDELYDQLLAKGEDHVDVKDERIPYWAEIWPSSLGLATFILRHPDYFRGKTILELGAGLGIAGLAAAKVGGQVLLTDYMPDPLEVAAFIWQLNFGKPVQTQLLDWREPPSEQWDVVIAADVMYEARAIEPVALALSKLVRPNGHAFVSEPGREVVKQWWLEMAKAGNAKKRLSVSATDGIRQNVTVYEWVLEQKGM